MDNNFNMFLILSDSSLHYRGCFKKPDNATGAFLIHSTDSDSTLEACIEACTEKVCLSHRGAQTSMQFIICIFTWKRNVMLFQKPHVTSNIYHIYLMKYIDISLVYPFHVTEK